MLLHGDGTNGAQNNTFTDSSTNNFTITRNGNTTQGTFSPYGSNWSNYFDGSAAYLTTSSSAISYASDFTVECWFNTTTTTTYACIYSDEGTTTGGTILLNNATNNGQITVYIGSSVLNFTSTTTGLNNGKWNHVALSRSGTTLRLFINGVLENTTTVSGTITSSSTFRIANSFFGGRLFNGYISNFRVTNTAVYTSAFTPSTTPLTAISGTSLLTCQSNRFIDNSSNNFTMTVAGGTPSVQRFSPFSPTTAYSTSVIGGSGYFDGSGDYLTAPTSSSFNLFNQTNATVEFWVYLNSYSSDQDPVSYYASGSSEWFCQLAGGQAGQPIKWWVDGSGQNVAGNTTSSTFPIKAWHHLAFVKSGSNWTIYLNGAQLATAATAPSVSISGTLYVGGRTSTINLVNGYLADVRITNTVVYSSAFTPPTAPLTAISGTQLLLNNTNAGILDNAMMNDLETVGNAQISTSVKKYGTGSMYFDGAGDYLKTNMATPDLYAFGSGDFTIEFWGYILQTTPEQMFIDWRPAGTQTTQPLIYVTSAGVLAYYVNAANRITGATLSTSTWYHIAVSRSGTSTKMFLNGTQTGSTWTDTTVYTNVAGRPVIGLDGNTTNSGYLNGYIDDLRITKGVARYTTTFTPPTAAFPNN